MNYSLPVSLTVGGKEYSIRSDFRAVLDIFTALNDPALNDSEKVYVALFILYEDFESIPQKDYADAWQQCCFFINGGTSDTGAKAPKLVDWEQDFPLIVAPVNRLLGRDVRGDADLHWWTFLSAFYEVGDCTFAQVVAIRDKKARGKKLEKYEREWYGRNRSLVDFKRKYAEADLEELRKHIL